MLQPLAVLRLAVLLVGLSTIAQPVDVLQLPQPANREVYFQVDIQPILDTSCVRCHGAEQPKSGFRLIDRESALEGGDGGVVIQPGDSANSPLIHYVAGLVEDTEMPPAGKGEPLTSEQIGLLRAWIDQGVNWSSEQSASSREVLVSSQVRWIGVDGDQRQFQEHVGIREGWSGGLQHFYWREQVDPKTELTVDGRGFYDEGDYGLALQLRRRDVGFIRAGVDTRTEYDDDTGGWYPPYGPAPSLGRDLEAHRGRTWIDLGLDLPDWPKVGLGYEYHWREGELSTLAWGVAAPAPPPDPGKAILPNARRIDERTHILKLDLQHDLAGWYLEDNVRAEFYELETDKNLQGDGGAGVTGRYREDYQHIQASNVLRAEKQLLPWLFTSAGYLYASLQGDGSFAQTITLTGPPDFSFAGDAAPDITLHQDSHTVNGNTQLGSWSGMTINGGLQAEWLRRRGVAGLLTPIDALPGQGASSINRRALDETATMKFDRVPLTVLYGTGRWQQEWIDHREEQTWDDSPFAPIGFERETETTGGRSDLGGGVNFAPKTWLSVDTSYWHRRRTQDFAHPLDRDLTTPPTDNANGYPAFILGRKTIGDEINGRVTWRLRTYWKLTLAYQYADMDYHTETAPSTILDFSDPFAPIPVLLPGGSLLAGRERSHTYSTSLALRLFHRLNLSATASYMDSFLDTALTDGVIVAPYAGQVVTVLSSASFAWTSRTDLRAAYGFSHADYAQEELIEGLPLGIAYDRHTLSTAVTHRLSDTLSGTLAYGLYEYSEPTAGGANDYLAHAVTCGVTYQWK
jgi:hypothetical protein